MLDFVQFIASRSRGSALQIIYFFATFIAKGSIYERRNEECASDSLGDAAIKLYKVEGKISGQRDLNPRPTAPKAVALAKLRYAPICKDCSSPLELRTRA